MHIKTHQRLIRSAFAIGLVLSLICGMTTLLEAKDDKEAKTDSSAAKKKREPKTGAELYAMHCNRCHPERYPAEWNSREWPTIMAQMRVRANIPAAQSREILKYLKEESGN